MKLSDEVVPAHTAPEKESRWVAGFPNNGRVDSFLGCRDDDVIHHGA